MVARDDCKARGPQLDSQPLPHPTAEISSHHSSTPCTSSPAMARRGKANETEPLLAEQPESRSRCASPVSTIDGHERRNGPQQLSTWHAFAILVGIQIGSGIFASPGQVDSNVPSPGAALVVWLLGGILSWAGAASFAELGAAVPLNGGMQEYLRLIFGDTAAFLMAWIWIMAVKPSSMAIQSIVIAESISSMGATALSPGTMKLVAVLACVLLFLLNSINTKTTLRLSEAFTVVKISAVVLVALCGTVAVCAHFIDPESRLSPSDDWYTRRWFQPRASVSEGRRTEWGDISSWDRWGHYAAAVYASVWAYDGWDNANFVASEIKNPGTSLPKAIKAAMLVVLISYELVNIAFYVILPWDTLSSQNSVAVAAASSLFGWPAGILITILVSLSCAGSISSNVFSVGRLTVAAAQHNYLPHFLSIRGIPADPVGLMSTRAPLLRDDCSDTTRASLSSGGDATAVCDAPLFANALALAITLIYIISGSFRVLLIFVGMAEWVFYVTTVVGLLILRRRERDLERPFRPNVALPVTFVIVGTAIILRSAVFAPLQSGVLAVLLSIGILISKLR
ncbi:amino acid transporter [Sporormia fimetaria CBS 119925]|uniref:Amino acid transporter n=1 Tax=Sporormia fimetaria CBS 119925 TaxID=1340428 RepID=A0A6A6V5B0_9PLEO|nr:amino acid transporter [Sporormia fimetaria CBS 119925]